jgi:hypothetical protein
MGLRTLFLESTVQEIASRALKDPFATFWVFVHTAISQVDFLVKFMPTCLILATGHPIKNSMAATRKTKVQCSQNITTILISLICPFVHLIGTQLIAIENRLLFAL